METVKRKMLSVCIPCHEMKGYDGFLRQSFDSLAAQTFKDFEVIISNNSKGDGIKKICDDYAHRLHIRYFYNPPSRKYNQPINLNNAIRKAEGKLIKVLFLDDFLCRPDALQLMVNSFDLEKDNWLVTSCKHTKDGETFFWEFIPKYNDKIHLGENTIGSPSVLMIKNENPIPFDENMSWAVDADYYKMCHAKFGLPKIVPEICVVIRMHADQQTNTICNKDVRGREFIYTTKKWGETELYKEHMKYWNWRANTVRFLRKSRDRVKVFFTKFWKK